VNKFAKKAGAVLVLVLSLVLSLALLVWAWNSPKMLIVGQALSIAVYAIPQYARVSRRIFGRSAWVDNAALLFLSLLAADQWGLATGGHVCFMGSLFLAGLYSVTLRDRVITLSDFR
jgi:hypothetical protein